MLYISPYTQISIFLFVNNLRIHLFWHFVTDYNAIEYFHMTSTMERRKREKQANVHVTNSKKWIIKYIYKEFR